MQVSPDSEENAQSISHSWVSAIALVVLASIFGFGSGALVSHVAPSDKFSLVGLAVAPLWFLVELYFESVIGVLGVRSKSLRAFTTAAVLAGFYGAWFAFHP